MRLIDGSLNVAIALAIQILSPSAENLCLNISCPSNFPQFSQKKQEIICGKRLKCDGHR